MERGPMERGVAIAVPRLSSGPPPGSAEGVSPPLICCMAAQARCGVDVVDRQGLAVRASVGRRVSSLPSVTPVIATILLCFRLVTIGGASNQGRDSLSPGLRCASAEPPSIVPAATSNTLVAGCRRSVCGCSPVAADGSGTIDPQAAPPASEDSWRGQSSYPRRGLPACRYDIARRAG